MVEGQMMVEQSQNHSEAAQYTTDHHYSMVYNRATGRQKYSTTWVETTNFASWLCTAA
jgi:hypothetical protein